MTVTDSDRWAAQELRARREKKKLTQERLADLAEIDRSAYNALENGRRKITPTYATRLAPHLGLTDPRKLLPPEEQPQTADNPLSRLGELAATVDRLETTLDAVLSRLEALEARAEPRRRPASGGR